MSCCSTLPLIMASRRILYEFSTSDEPAWTYFDAQHKHIMQHMRDTYNNAVKSIEGSWPPYVLWDF